MFWIKKDIFGRVKEYMIGFGPPCFLNVALRGYRKPGDRWRHAFGIDINGGRDNMFKIKMEAKVKDSVTGFAGVVTARAEYLTGCRQYLVQAKSTKDKYGENVWLDEDRILPKPALKKNNGGPQMHPAPTK